VTALGLAFGAAVVSGAAALVYEVMWPRTLSLVVSHAVDALTAVLAAYSRSPQGRYTVEVIARDVAVNPIPGGPRV
jgi:hypothetical protein